jgi:hypothetical protein
MCIIDWNALGTWAIALLTLLTLINLRIYVRDTASLAQTAKRELEASQRPIIAIYFQTPGKIYMRSVSSGVAFNVRWYRMEADGKSVPHTTVFLENRAPVLEIFIGDAIFFEQFGESKVDVLYDSLSGTCYQTTAKIVAQPQTGAQNMELSFREIARV